MKITAESKVLSGNWKRNSVYVILTWRKNIHKCVKSNSLSDTKNTDVCLKITIKDMGITL